MSELERCPFCGGSGLIYDIYYEGRKVFRVMCKDRQDCCMLLDCWETPGEAATAWNARAKA